MEDRPLLFSSVSSIEYSKVAALTRHCFLSIVFWEIRAHSKCLPDFTWWHNAYYFISRWTTDVPPYEPPASNRIGILIMKKAVEFILEKDECSEILAVNP